MIALAAAQAARFRATFVGGTLPVLYEEREGGYWTGLTDNYIRVYTRSAEDLANRLRPTRLGGAHADGLLGTC